MWQEARLLFNNAYILASKEERRRAMKKIKLFIIPSLFLILIDQFIKIIISSSFMQYDFDIIGNVLRFSPVINTNLSWAGNFVNIFSIPLFTISFNLIALYIFISGYALYKAKRSTISLSVKVIMICGIAGCLCSLIDKLFWGGSLDFIQIPNFFIFDLKDCYLSVAGILFVILGILNSKEISVKEYFHFCYNKFNL